jgi:RNA polymerase sigma factor (sigma-70 family)
VLSRIPLLEPPQPESRSRSPEIDPVLSQTVVIAADPGTGAPPDFIAVYEAHYPRLVRALEISGLDRPAAEDVAQEAFARTFGHWRRVRLGTNPPGYAYRVGFRLARRTFRREDPLVVEPTSSGDIAAQVATREAIEGALQAMPPRRRSCAVMCLMSGLTTKEAARSLGIAEGTVRKQLELARSTLRGVLGDSRL